MRIVTLVAVFREDPDALAETVDQALDVGPVVVLADVSDNIDSWLPLVGKPGVVLERGSYQREREKRNALVSLASDHLGTGPGDWLLVLDPDEGLLAPQALRRLLSEQAPGLPAYPLLRQERDGRIFAMPSKCLRGDVLRYSYLDIGVAWHGESWNLDPLYLGRGSILPGWPGVIHYGSTRANWPTDDFYSEQVEPPGWRHNSFPYSDTIEGVHLEP